MTNFKNEIKDHCDIVIADFEHLITEIKNERYEQSRKITNDETVNVYAVVERCNKLNAMLKIAEQIKEVFEREQVEELKILQNKIIEFSAFVEIEYPTYKKLMSLIKDIYLNLHDFAEKTAKRRYFIDVELLFNDDIKKYDTIASISMDIVLNKKLLNKDMNDDLANGDAIVDRIEKINDLEFILRFITTIPDNN